MLTTSDLLRRLLHKEHNFCCLCIKSIDQKGVNCVDVTDEVTLQENYPNDRIQISDMLSFVFGDQVYSNISAVPTICTQCVSTVVDMYRFAKDVKSNADYLTDTISSLNQFFDELPKDITPTGTLFVTINDDLSIDNLHCEHMDNIRDASVASTVLNSLLNGTYKKEREEKIGVKANIVVKKEESPKKRTGNIRTIDMVHKKDMCSLVCKVCLREFPSVNNLRNHYLRMHAAKQFYCPDCSKGFATKALLNTHQAGNHICNMCSECGKTFNNVWSLKNHEKSHYLQLVCQDCGRVYKNENTYKKHIDNEVCHTAVRHSPSNAKFTCDYCGKKYTQKITLRVHIQYEHLNYKYHECQWCDKKFWCQSRLKAHVVKHTKEKNFVCTICDGRFVSKESLLYHTRIHTGEKPYSCPHCESKFLSASRRQAHIKSQHTNPTIECDVCHFKFKSLNYLTKHKKIHEMQTDSERKTDAAPIDDAVNTQQLDHDIIERSHQAIECDICHLKFKSVKYLMKHKKVHEEKPVELHLQRESETIKVLNIQPIVYNVIETGQNMYELQAPDDSGDVYLEGSEEEYDFKVSQNVEI